MIYGNCPKCDTKKPACLIAQPYTSSATGKLMICVTANCISCGAAIDMTWVHFPFIETDERSLATPGPPGADNPGRK